jgi:hypothetical protein
MLPTGSMFFMNDVSAQGITPMRIDDCTRIFAKIFTLMPSKPKQNVNVWRLFLVTNDGSYWPHGAVC